MRLEGSTLVPEVVDHDAGQIHPRNLALSSELGSDEAASSSTLGLDGWCGSTLLRGCWKRWTSVPLGVFLRMPKGRTKHWSTCVRLQLKPAMQGKATTIGPRR